jgi:hypothetical protein
MKRATRLTTGFDAVVLAFLRGEPPPATLTKAQQDAACSLALLAAPPGHGVIGGQVVMLPEGCDRDNPHWQAWLDAEVVE